MLIAVVVVLSIIVGLYFVAVKWDPDKNKENESKQDTTYDVEYIIDEEPENVASVEFMNNGISYTVYNEETPRIEGYNSNITDKASLTSAIFNATSIAATKNLGKKGDISSYGLDKKEQYVKVSLKSGEEKTLIIGNSANFNGEFYVKLADSDVVYTIASYTAETLLQSPDEYRSLATWQIDNTTVSSFEVHKNGEKVLQVEYDEDFVATNEYQPVSYLITYPYESVKANLDSLDAFFKELSSVTAESIVEENPSDLSVYGLDKPYILTVKDATNNTTIKMGSYADNGAIYVMQENEPVVYTAKCSFYEKIKSVNPEEYVDRFIHIFNIDTVSEIIVENKEEKHTLTITEKSEDNFEYTIDGKIKVKDNFTPVFTNIIGITASDFLNEEPSGKEKCKITFTFNDKTTKAFTYYEYDDRNCIVKADSQMTCLALTKSIDAIFESLS